MACSRASFDFRQQTQKGKDQFKLSCLKTSYAQGRFFIKSPGVIPGAFFECIETISTTIYDYDSNCTISVLWRSLAVSNAVLPSLFLMVLSILGCANNNFTISV